MNYRITEVLPAEDLGASGVKNVEIDIGEVISRLRFRYSFTNGVPLINIAHPAKCLSKVELLDGSDVLESLSGMEMQAVNFYDTKKTPINFFDIDASSVQYAVMDFNFGTYLFDEELAFDPTKFTNPKLSITFDEDAANTTAGVGTLEILAYVFDEKAVSPAGFLMNKEHHLYTPAASSHKYIDLPDDYVLRSMFLKATTTDVDPVAQISNIKITEDNDKRIPYNISALDLALFDMEEYGLLRERLTNDLAITATDWYVTPAYRVGVIPVNTGTVAAAAELPSITIAHTHVSLGASTTTLRNKTYIDGALPHGVFAIPFGNPMDSADWYDIRAIKSLKTDILTTADDQTGGEVALVLQQYRPY